MGMDIVVGVFPELYDSADDEIRAKQREEFAAINRALRAAGLPEHHEPETARGAIPWNCRVGSWVCVHYLRRIAASIVLGKVLPPPVTDLPPHDPLVDVFNR